MAKQRETNTRATEADITKIEKRRLAKNLASRNYRAKLRAKRMADNVNEPSGSEPEIVQSEVGRVESEGEGMAAAREEETESVAPEGESIATAPEGEIDQEKVVVDEAFAERLAEAVKPKSPVSVYDALNRTTNAGPLPNRPPPKQGDMWLGALHRDRSLQAAEKLEHAPTKKIEYGERLAEEKEAEEEDLGVLGGKFSFFDEEFERIMAARELDKRMEAKRSE